MIERYARAFRSKDLKAIEELLTDDVVLEDPSWSVSGKTAVLEVYAGLFLNEIRKLDILRTFKLNDEMIAFEFALELVDQEAQMVEVVGVDCLTLRGGKICHLRAYLAG